MKASKMNPQYSKPVCPVTYWLDKSLGRKILSNHINIENKVPLDTTVLKIPSSAS